MGAAELASILKSARPRETSGSRTVGRYGFQANVGILKLLELRENGNDFCLVFDIFDDLVVLDSCSSPTQISLYQVKSKDPGDWSTTDLCAKSGKMPPRSIVARLYAHLDMFGDALAETGLITNAPYKLLLTSGTHSPATQHRIDSHQIHADELEKIAKAVLADIKPANVPAWLPKLTLIRTTLGVHGQELVIKGRLLEHFEKLGIADGINITGVYETLHASIQHKTGFSQEGLDQAEVFQRKTLTSADIQELINRSAAAGRGFLSDWETIRADLDKAGVGSLEIIKLKTLAIAYRQGRQGAQPQAKRLADYIAAWVPQNPGPVDACTTIPELVKLLMSALPNDFGYGKRELHAALIVEAYGAIHDTT